jgi:hypothetical protein
MFPNIEDIERRIKAQVTDPILARLDTLDDRLTKIERRLYWQTSGVSLSADLEKRASLSEGQKHKVPGPTSP